MTGTERHWIHRSSDIVSSDDTFLDSSQSAKSDTIGQKKTVSRSVYMSWPVLVLGFVGIVFLSFLVTYLSVRISPDSAGFEADSGTTRLDAITTNDAPPGQAVTAPDPAATPTSRPQSVRTPDEQNLAHLDDGPIKMKKIKIFSGGQVTSVEVPIEKLQLNSYLDLDLISRERSLRHPATPLSLVPEERTFAEALGITDPMAIIDLPERHASIQAGLQSPGKKLLPKRYAFAVSEPVFDMGAHKERSGFSTAVLGEQPKPILKVEAYQDVPGQKLLPKRYAKLVNAPAKLEESPMMAVTPAPVTLPSEESFEAWRKYAAKVPPGADGKAKIVIIIDDMGHSAQMAQRLGELEGPLNFAFLPYAPGVKTQTKDLREKGHELLVHMPMEPMGNENPGPNALKVGLTPQDLHAAIEWNLTRFEGFVGVNNHMGSRFTKDSAAMTIVMDELKKRGLLFLDSVTTGSSQGAVLAQQEGLPWAGRDVFLDNEIDEAAIQAQLMKVERIARKKGLVIAIGHPHGATYRALKAWIPTLEAKGFVLVPVSSVVEFHGTRKLAVAPLPAIASD